MGKATAIAHANIAFIKYWGVRDAARRLPTNNSLSMNLDTAYTTTTVEFAAGYGQDVVLLDGVEVAGRERARVVEHLDRVRARAGMALPARVVSVNSFPTAAGIASSASGFAALTVAACTAAGLHLSERELSVLARLGSGSACRSVPGGFVEWQAGESSEDSYAVSLFPPEHWDLRDVVAIVGGEAKAVSSTAGHAAAPGSPFFPARLATLPERLARLKAALAGRDFAAFAPLVEEEALSMHAVMLTSRPAILYWAPGTVRLVQAVWAWRAAGLPVCFTIDAGPNVHVLCLPEAQAEVERRLHALAEVQSLLPCRPAGGTRLVEVQQT